MSQLVVRFAGGLQVCADYRGRTIVTDQPEEDGGGGTAPSPYDLFLASMATCAGYYVLRFCRSRGIPVEGIRLEQEVERDPESRRLVAIRQRLHLPPEFPEKYRDAVLRAAESCTVKKALEDPPRVEVQVVRNG